MPRDCLSGPEEAIDVWPRVAVRCRMKHAKSAFYGFQGFGGFGAFGGF